MLLDAALFINQKHMREGDVKQTKILMTLWQFHLFLCNIAGKKALARFQRVHLSNRTCYKTVL